MKKIKLLLIGIILLYISTMLADEVTLYNITPSLLLPWVVYLGATMDYRYCLSYTFFVSVANDLLNPQLLGFTTILFLLMAHFTYRYHTSINKSKWSTIVFVLLLINGIFFGVQWLYFAFTAPDPLYLLGKAGFTTAYNTFLSCILILLIYIIDKLRIVAYD